MKKIISLFFLFAAALIFADGVSSAAEYRQVNTSKGKVILGLDMEKAYRIFGAPSARGEDLWYYSASPGFYVGFSRKPRILLYPEFFRATIGVPMEFKVFLSAPDSGIQDITKDAELILDNPECARILSPGVILPKKTGSYSALVAYKGVISNPLYIQINDPSGEIDNEKEKLLSIDILPYRPEISFESSINFIALGTFYDSGLDKYSVRDISQEATWYIRQGLGRDWSRESSRQLYFLEKGPAEVMVKYGKKESFPLRLEIKDRVDYAVRRLKHILVLPETMVILVDGNVNLRAFGTYYDNSVIELTQDVTWKISDPRVLGADKNGNFYTRSEGITDITASKDGIESLPVKVAVVNKSSHFLEVASVVSPKKEEPSGQNAFNEIKKDIEKLKKDLAVKKKILERIEITPASLEIGLGEESKFSATGFYSDGTTGELTVLGKWGTLNKAVGLVSSGKVRPLSLGQTSVYVEYKGVRSGYAALTVGEARLVSLLLAPPEVKIPMGGKAGLKVTGNYYDHSQKDLTAQVSWVNQGEAVARVERGVLHPLRFGKSKLWAEYSRLKSNSADIEVVFTWGWLFWLLARIFFAALLALLAAAGVLFLIAKNKKNKLCALKDKPGELILGLHENATRLISIFGLNYDNYTAPLNYAELAKRKFMVEDDAFLSFSVKFEEAKYSRHLLKDADASSAIGYYNRFFDKLCNPGSRLLSFWRYLLALLHCRPVFIFPPSGEKEKSAPRKIPAEPAPGPKPDIK